MGYFSIGRSLADIDKAMEMIMFLHRFAGMKIPKLTACMDRAEPGLPYNREKAQLLFAAYVVTGFSEMVDAQDQELIIEGTTDLARGIAPAGKADAFCDLYHIYIHKNAQLDRIAEEVAYCELDGEDIPEFSNWLNRFVWDVLEGSAEQDLEEGGIAADAFSGFLLQSLIEAREAWNNRGMPKLS